MKQTQAPTSAQLTPKEAGTAWTACYSARAELMRGTRSAEDRERIEALSAVMRKLIAIESDGVNAPRTEDGTRLDPRGPRPLEDRAERDVELPRATHRPLPCPVLWYDLGHPTALLNSPVLAEMLRELGEPRIIQGGGGSYRLEWAPLYPGVPIPEYNLRNPWPRDKRTLVRVSLDPARRTGN